MKVLLYLAVFTFLDFPVFSVDVETLTQNQIQTGKTYPVAKIVSHGKAVNDSNRYSTLLVRFTSGHLKKMRCSLPPMTETKGITAVEVTGIDVDGEPAAGLLGRDAAGMTYYCTPRF
ncbi:hypothetical protein K2X33_02150 [bacterium]|nr:hypothetical protein [bacterium]